MEEPTIRVGIMQVPKTLQGRFNGTFYQDTGRRMEGCFSIRAAGGKLAFEDASGQASVVGERLHFRSGRGASFSLSDVTIGVRFHWERKQEQTFLGDLLVLAGDGETLTVINEICLEDYLSSVISSEMSATAPLEMLKAHAVTSRSWLVAMLRQKEQKAVSGVTDVSTERKGDEIIRWYGRDEHDCFDVCADDHCQRYQGITKIISDQAAAAVRATRGNFLVYAGAVCDARYHKACGGRTENFENTWGPAPVHYLSSVVDSDVPHAPAETEAAAQDWICTRPSAYCNTTDTALLRRILPAFDQETTDFFRWKVVYDREELEDILREKSGIDFGLLQNMTSLQRGPSGRIVRLRIEGSKRTFVVGKELEIRRWLSRTHLYSSALHISVDRDASGLPVRFILNGAGWGHGVGLCQIGAAVMAERGFRAEEILKHYFPGACLEKRYD